MAGRTLIQLVAEEIKRSLIEDRSTDAYMQSDRETNDFLIDGCVNLDNVAEDLIRKFKIKEG